MNKMIVLMSACAVLTTLTVVDAQEVRDDKAKTQGDIMNERAHACEGLKGLALQQCMENYVGPSRDANSGAPESAAAPDQKGREGSEQKSRDATEQKSKEQAAGAEHDGSTQVDTQRSYKRAPVGPIKSGPGDKQQ
jgi:hypothetical protein